MCKKEWFMAVIALTGSILYAQGNPLRIQSPDQKIQITVSTDKQLSLFVQYQQADLVTIGPIGLTLDGNRKLGPDASIKNTVTRSVEEQIQVVVPEKFSIVPDVYNELTLHFDSFGLIIRAYNDGIAYRFTTALPGTIQVVDEQVKFTLTGNPTVYFGLEDSFYSHSEREYLPMKLEAITDKQFAPLPVVADIAGGPKVAIVESDLRDYPGLYLQGTSGSSLTGILPKAALETENTSPLDVKVKTRADYLAKTEGTRAFPWRAVIFAAADKDLLTNQMVYKLAEPCKLKDPSWIKPGKVAWDWWNANNIYGVDFKSGINTETYKYYIDFASKYGIEYIIIDDGWSPQDDLLTTKPGMNIPEIVNYGKQKNVGVILWMSWVVLDRQLQPALEQFAKWGVVGLKVDFMQRDDQWMVNYYERILAEAAKYKMLVDFHGAYKPTGLRRTYPNYITQEGVRGNEWNKWSDSCSIQHTITLPFTRMVAGPMDFTPGAMRNAGKAHFNYINERPMSIGTRCRQLAMYVLYDSPLQMLCDSPSNYLREPECMEFLAAVPAVWHNTIALDAKIADYAVMARQYGGDWYIGGMNGEKAMTCTVDCSFLPEGQFELTLFQDGVNADRFAEDYRKITKTITRQDKLEIKLVSGGGFAGRMVRK
ncbi:MAG TPA: glycoside hydrolase family 97 protein [Anaerohalosphaeraceae bacterium]|nr:glycoside hydrolase family 97 protein [Anaerohalosphaeraceae bacterium]